MWLLHTFPAFRYVVMQLFEPITNQSRVLVGRADWRGGTYVDDIRPRNTADPIVPHVGDTYLHGTDEYTLIFNRHR